MKICFSSERSRLVVVAFLLFACFLMPAMANGQEDDAGKIRQAFNAWAAGTGGPYDLLADDAVWTITGNSLASKTYSGREAFLSEVIRPFNARMRTGLKPVIRDLYRDGGTVVVLFDASGVARDGIVYSNTYAWFLDLQDGRIVRARAFFDSIAFNDLWTRVAPATKP